MQTDHPGRRYGRAEGSGPVAHSAPELPAIGDDAKTWVVPVACSKPVETLSGKMARTFLRHIRVQSWEELHNRILKGVAEINAVPAVHRWTKFDALTGST
jgi:hypothetical protein